jgi:hypothetical protein
MPFDLGALKATQNHVVHVDCVLKNIYRYMIQEYGRIIVTIGPGGATNEVGENRARLRNRSKGPHDTKQQRHRSTKTKIRPAQNYMSHGRAKLHVLAGQKRRDQAAEASDPKGITSQGQGFAGTMDIPMGRTGTV